QERVDELLAASGVEDVTVGVGGQTAIAAELAEITRENLQSILHASSSVPPPRPSSPSSPPT
ncbi:hypothetical protein E4P41_20210, partial [Geodermatophilus sp. DF01-2]|uniref:hypothetical protein n=1 Tax=Geodermatophilus sp. DF01-2 TaxID=2559610 RepID=UPI0010734696